jgi:LAO/AO transport system kinase
VALNYNLPVCTVQINDDNIKKLRDGDVKTISRLITIVENKLDGADTLLQQLQFNEHTALIGITGAPGAGKSTIVNSLVKHIVEQGKKIAVVSVDPSSPFNYGAILGDRIRMSEHFLNTNVYIRSVATRGALGGLSMRLYEIIDVIRASNFDYIIIETVGIGQSEVDIAGVADTKIVVLVPEGGDEVQAMKAGVMEIADIFVVNKADRPNASEFAATLTDLSHNRSAIDGWQIPVIKTEAHKHVGIDGLLEKIEQHKLSLHGNSPHKLHMQTEKAYQLIQQQRMSDIDKLKLRDQLAAQTNINVYEFIRQYL